MFLLLICSKSVYPLHLAWEGRRDFFSSSKKTCLEKYKYCETKLSYEGEPHGIAIFIDEKCQEETIL